MQATTADPVPPALKLALLHAMPRTPAKPIARPSTRVDVRRSCSQRRAINAPNSGDAALKIDDMPALIWGPAQPLSAASWLTGAALAFVCTGLAYILYFRLIARIGPANAITVTFLIPAFAVVWGWLFLDELVTLAMVVGCAVIVIGTALATGLLRWPLRTPAAAG